MDSNFTEQKALDELAKRYAEAEDILEDEDKIERLLQRLEKKIKAIPLAGDKLSKIPLLVSLIRSYVKKQYTDIPIGSIIAIISALIYFISPIDFIPDSIPVLGYFDDAAVVAACWKLVESDVEEYIRWRKDSGMELDI